MYQLKKNTEIRNSVHGIPRNPRKADKLLFSDSKDYWNLMQIPSVVREYESKKFARNSVPIEFRQRPNLVAVCRYRVKNLRYYRAYRDINKSFEVAAIPMTVVLVLL
jgi:hypothetical protein